MPIAAHSPAGFRVSSIAEIIHPPSLALRTGTLGAASGPIGPLPAETVSRYVYRHAMRYVRGYVRGTTHRHPEPIVRRYVVRDAGRYVSGYVRGTIHRYAAHTIRRYVSDMVCRYAVGYVCRNLARQRVHHARCPVNGGLLGRVRHYARAQVVGYVWRHLWQPRGRLGGRPVVAHLACTLAPHRAHRRSAHLGSLGVPTVMSRRVQHLDDLVTAKRTALVAHTAWSHLRHHRSVQRRSHVLAQLMHTRLQQLVRHRAAHL